MNYLEITEMLVDETIKDIENHKLTWFDIDFLNPDGTINKTVLIKSLEDWNFTGKSDVDMHKSFSDLIEEMKSNNDVFDTFVLYSGNKLREHFGYDWELLNLMQFYGYAIKKVIGAGAKNITVVDFNNVYVPNSVEMTVNQTNCVKGYSWAIDSIKKDESKELQSLLPVMRSKRARVKKKYIKKIKINARSCMKTDSMCKHGQKNADRFDNSPKNVLERFRKYSVKVNFGGHRDVKNP